MHVAQLVSITNSVEEPCDGCFSSCESLSRVTIGWSSSLEWIGKDAFRYRGVVEIHILGGVEELCEKCFWCARVFHMLHLVRLLH